LHIYKTRNWKELERNEFAENRIVYWAYGDHEPKDAFICNSQAKKMGFEYKFVLGCIVNSENKKYIERHNKKVNKKLSKTLGKNWDIKFYKKVDSLNIVSSNIIDQIQRNGKLWDTLSPILDSIKYSLGTYFLHDTDSPLRFIMNYSEMDNNFSETRILYSLEVLLPYYTLKIIRQER
jgi:hypothetical protein